VEREGSSFLRPGPLDPFRVPVELWRHPRRHSTTARATTGPRRTIQKAFQIRGYRPAGAGRSGARGLRLSAFWDVTTTSATR
jgi:hypothetical protein